MGRTGWGCKPLEPYFIKSENALSLDSEFRGSKGLWTDQQLPYIPFLNATQRTVDAAQKIGLPLVDDPNCAGAPLSGCVFLDSTVDEKRQRVSAQTGYLSADLVHSRAHNLVICTSALVSQVLFTRSPDGELRAKGVSFGDTSSGDEAQTYVVNVQEEVMSMRGRPVFPSNFDAEWYWPQEAPRGERYQSLEGSPWCRLVSERLSVYWAQL